MMDVPVTKWRELPVHATHDMERAMAVAINTGQPLSKVWEAALKVAPTRAGLEAAEMLRASQDALPPLPAGTGLVIEKVRHSPEAKTLRAMHEVGAITHRQHLEALQVLVRDYVG